MPLFRKNRRGKKTRTRMKIPSSLMERSHTSDFKAVVVVVAPVFRQPGTTSRTHTLIARWWHLTHTRVLPASQSRMERARPPFAVVSSPGECEATLQRVTCAVCATPKQNGSVASSLNERRPSFSRLSACDGCDEGERTVGSQGDDFEIYYFAF
uniref:(northern house mosquito) hypothetical protein n=2 Tax=Culex pipiens TaxID=7175 RepID=A0A8D8IB19_CULPI